MQRNIPPYHNRPGRPAGPPEGRGQRPYDPRWGTRKRMKILSAVYTYRRELARGDIKLCEIAPMIGTSISYLSTVKNSPWGQRILRTWAIKDGEDPDQWSRQ